MCKNRIITIILFLSLKVFSQNAFQNFGNVKIHNKSKIGFHTNLVNKGILDDDNLGFVGFYHPTEQLYVAGTRPEFYNVEVDVSKGLLLETTMAVTNEFTFLEGDVITDKNDTNVSLEFNKYQFHIGEDDDHYVDGYNSVKSYNSEFIFPVGDDDRYRPMMLPSQNNNFKGAYFFEDPNTPTTFSTFFDTNEKEASIHSVSELEFWDLDGAKSTSITLTWDNQSDIVALADNIKSLTVVGWHITDKKWVNLGNSKVLGDLNSGEITSLEFTPNDYEAITIGSLDGQINISCDELFNTLNDKIENAISPNGDSMNQVWSLDELYKYCEKCNKKASVEIFNRWGNTVYKQDKYFESLTKFSGQAQNAKRVISKKKNLPVGTYFYIIKTQGNDPLKGWIYIGG